MTDTPLWKKMDWMEDMPCRLSPSDHCIYAREYVSRGGFEASETNDLITNYKIDVSCRGGPRWRHKKRAVNCFAKELVVLLDSDREFFVTAIPPSKKRGAEDYDPRFEMTFDLLTKALKNVHVITPVERKISCQAVHHRDQRPSIDEIYESLEWKDAPSGCYPYHFR